MENLNSYIHATAYLLIGMYYVFFAFWNIYHWRPLIETLLQRHIPHPFFLLPVTIVLQSVLGFMIIFGLFVKIAAFILIPFTFISILIFHPFWKFHGELRKLNFSIFITNLTMCLGALLLLILVSPSLH